MLEVPVALIVFNRPEVTLRTFEVVRRAGPKRLLIISDGPRPDRQGEAELVRATREVVSKVDWPCLVTKLYSEHNLGCGRRISSGITRAFKLVDSLIVLEDDCLADASFFDFAARLLDRYAEDERVMSISGSCFHDQVPGVTDSYYFSKYAHCWGWATWRRAWRHYSYTIRDWPRLARSRAFAELFDTNQEQLYWTNKFDRVTSGRVSTWDFQWLLACWLHGGLTAIPTKNLVSNIGFSARATHTKQPSDFANRPTTPLQVIRHPEAVVHNAVADEQLDARMFSGTWRPPHLLKFALNGLRRNWQCRQRAA